MLRTLIDGHAHSEFSWDAPDGNMLESCRQALKLGLGGIAFTEHADLTDWSPPDWTAIPESWMQYRIGEVLRFPAVDFSGYLQAVEECRSTFPMLVILSGIEISEPHLHQGRVEELLSVGCPDRVISSVHIGNERHGLCEVSTLFQSMAPEEVVRAYLAEVLRMILTTPIDVLGHVDYPARYWPLAAPPFDPLRFEPEFRSVLAALAGRGAALEINTRLSPDPQLLDLWVQEGGRKLTFGSDSHKPSHVGAGLFEAAQLASGYALGPPKTSRRHGTEAIAQ